MKKLFILLTLCSIGFVQADNNPIDCLATAIYYEAKGEPYKGQVAVANVIMNRTESKHFPSDICAVIKQKKQFSWYKQGQKLPSNKISNTKEYQDALEIAKLVKLGMVDDNTNGSLFFHAIYVSPGWKYRRVNRIGNHIFYKL